MSVQELLDAERSVLVVIDLQGKLVEMAYRSRLLVEATKRLLRLAELFEVPVLLTEQAPEGIGPTVPEIRELFEEIRVPKRTVSKVSFGCCGEPAFDRALEELRPGRRPGERQLVLGGIEAHVCVYQTAVELCARGERVDLCWECVSGRGEEYRRHALERLARMGVGLTNHESVAFEWARTSEHPRFRSLNRLLRAGQIVG